MIVISRVLVSSVSIWVLAFCCTGAVAQEIASRDKIFKITDWTGYDLTTVLADGSSLYSYVAESNGLVMADDSAGSGSGIEKTEKNLAIRFTFLPRFKCSPLIELLGGMPSEMSSSTYISTLKNFNQIDLAIDGEAFDFPVEVEEQKNVVHSFMSASLSRRTSLQKLVELGDAAVVTFGDGTVTSVSLLGSRDTISQAQGRCRNHQ